MSKAGGGSRRFRRVSRRGQRGQSSVEYALLCAVVTILAYPLFGIFLRVSVTIVRAINQSIAPAYP